MDLKNQDLPVTLQAFDLQGNTEIFIAEQVVNSQAEIDLFTTRYTGKLIKAKKVAVSQNAAFNTVATKKRSSTTGLVMIIIIIILLALVIYGVSTGWIQEKLNLNI